MRHKVSPYPDLLPEEAWQNVATAYRLTDGELRVLRHLCSGVRNGEMAAKLCVTKATVRTHLRSIYAKLRCPDRVHVILRLMPRSPKK